MTVQPKGNETNKRGLITVSNEVYQYAIQCRDNSKSALKLQDLIKTWLRTHPDKEWQISRFGLQDWIKESEK